MPVRVLKVFSVVDGTLVQEGNFKRIGEIVGVLSALKAHPLRNGPIWAVDVTIAENNGVAQILPVALEPFLSLEEHKRSSQTPICCGFLEVGQSHAPRGFEQDNAQRVWIYRDAVYLSERVPKPSEIEEVVLRIKSLHFQDDEALKRLKEQVANFEAVEGYLGPDPTRQPIPDDVKLLVWARDGGACVKCGSRSELQFDHIIPLSRGGGDHADNIQLLCRSCNLKKGPRLV